MAGPPLSPPEDMTNRNPYSCGPCAADGLFVIHRLDGREVAEKAQELGQSARHGVGRGNAVGESVLPSSSAVAAHLSGMDAQDRNRLRASSNLKHYPSVASLFIAKNDCPQEHPAVVALDRSLALGWERTRHIMNLNGYEMAPRALVEMIGHTGSLRGLP